MTVQDKNGDFELHILSCPYQTSLHWASYYSPPAIDRAAAEPQWVGASVEQKQSAVKGGSWRERVGVGVARLNEDACASKSGLIDIWNVVAFSPALRAETGGK